MPTATRGAASTMFAELVHEAVIAAPERPCTTIPVMPRTTSAGAGSLDADVLSSMDSIIVTGTEPSTSELTADPVTALVSQVIDVASRASIPTSFSCFSAHAALGLLYNVDRRYLGTKHAGVFPHVVTDPCHPLLSGLAGRFAVPHSRWNTIDQQFLAAAGIAPLIVEESAQWHMAASDDAGWVFLQGHPEYAEDTLYREYRRDVRRYLLGAHEVYPSVPEAYLDGHLADLFSAFRERAEEDRRIELMEAFPPFDATGLVLSWRRSSVAFMSNWLRTVGEMKRGAS